MTTFTASEVRETAYKWPNWRVGDMLHAYADRLEADDKAQPVMVVNHVSSAEHDLPIGMKLYTRPAPSDAERLAEALRGILEIGKRNMENHKYDGFFNAAREALADHSAQAQPPAARVTDAMVNAAMRADFCGHNVADALMCGTDWNTEVMRAALEAALAAQENPNG